MTKKDLRTAKMLFRKLNNEVIERWGKGTIYDITIKSEESGVTIQSTRGDVFYGICDFIHVAEVCGCSCYVSVSKNEAGVMAPTLYVY